MRRVQKCASCGFPVSSGRTVCIDCERKDLHDKELQHKEKRDKEKRDKDREKELETRTAENPLPAPPAALQEKTQIEATSLQISDGAPADIVIDDAADASDQFVPAFLANSVPVKESWLSNHVNLLAIVVLILTILVAVVVFR
jgi:uncharacterized Zn finger protein (UPF0148 family)